MNAKQRVIGSTHDALPTPKVIVLWKKFRYDLSPMQMAECVVVVPCSVTIACCYQRFVSTRGGLCFKLKRLLYTIELWNSK